MELTVANDSYSFDDFGFLHIDAVLSHEGTLQYFDEEKQEWIGAYMPVESLEQLATDCQGSIVTSEHPVKDGKNVLVDNNNFKNVAVGYLKNDNFKLDGTNLIGSLVIADVEAQKDVLSGKKKGISLGYTEYKFPLKGTDSNGKAFESVKKGLKLNHIALVEEPRAVNALISLDSRNYTSSITGNSVQFRMDSKDFPTLIEHKIMTEETNNNSVDFRSQMSEIRNLTSENIKLQASFDSLKAELAEAKGANQDLSLKLEAANSATQGATAALDSYKESQPTQDAIDAIVAERVAAWAKVGDKVAFDSAMSALDIQRARLSIDFPSKAEQFKTASADYLDAFESAFDSLQASNPKAPKPLFDSAKCDEPVSAKKQKKENAFVMDADGTYSLFNLKKQPRKGY